MKKKIVILGAGESGVGAALLARLQGFTVFVSDKKLISPQHKKELEELGVDYEEDVHTLEKILSADIVVKSPGIPEKNEVVQLVREKKTYVIQHSWHLIFILYSSPHFITR